MQHPPTPKLTHHARQRCEEMGVRTGRVKAVLREPTMTLCSYDGCTMAWSSADPDIAVYFAERDGARVAVTVVPRTYETYKRGA